MRKLTLMTQMNPFMAFCLYVAGRVFVQYLRAHPNDQQTAASFHFLLSAMHALKKKNPLNCSFLAQLEMDMLGAGLRNPHAEQSAQDAPTSIDIVSLPWALEKPLANTSTVIPIPTRPSRLHFRIHGR